MSLSHASRALLERMRPDYRARNGGRNSPGCHLRWPVGLARRRVGPKSAVQVEVIHRPCAERAHAALERSGTLGALRRVIERGFADERRAKPQ